MVFMVLLGGGERVCAQPPRQRDEKRMPLSASDPYAPYANPSALPVSQPKRSQPPPSLSPSDVARRSRVVARAGDVVITVGELEDALARAPRPDREAFQFPHWRRAFVEKMLRRKLLIRAAAQRGIVPERLPWEARRRIDRVLRDVLEDEIRSNPGPLPPPSPPREVPEERFAVILIASSRDVVQRWAQENQHESFHMALERARMVGDGQQTPYGQKAKPPEESIDPRLWRVLFEMKKLGSISPPISIGRGRWAAVMFAGQRGGYVEEGPDEEARRMIAGDRAWAELVAQVRAERVRDVNPQALDGVYFQVDLGTDPKNQAQIAREVEATLQAMQREREGLREEASQ
ncbi:MAG: hypothetical protein NZM37_03940 [Sandaracinaceae bacterium]|nr:hypothetical protein [Sandaracinaceae bacterium]